MFTVFLDVTSCDMVGTSVSEEHAASNFSVEDIVLQLNQLRSYVWATIVIFLQDAEYYRFRIHSSLLQAHIGNRKTQLIQNSISLLLWITTCSESVHTGV
jgi:hypothetical protein